MKLDLSSGIEKPLISESPIKITEEFVKPERKMEFKWNLIRKTKIENKLYADQLKWDGLNHIIVKPNEAYYMLQEQIRLPLP